MPHLTVNGVSLYYELTGEGPETIVFAHGLLWSGRMFEAQVAHFSARYRCLTFDFRGQGQSAISKDGYDMDTLAEDAAALIEALGLAPCHFAGLSMGGFIGMRLAARRSALVRSLVLLETSADPEPPENVPRYAKLNMVVKWLGIKPVVNTVMNIMFGRDFLEDPTRKAERNYWRNEMKKNRPKGITRAVEGVIFRKGVYDELPQIQQPTLILVGDQDVATVPAKSERIQARIAGSKLVILPGAGHSSTIETPGRVNAELDAFWKSLT